MQINNNHNANTSIFENKLARPEYLIKINSFLTVDQASKIAACIKNLDHMYKNTVIKACLYRQRAQEIEQTITNPWAKEKALIQIAVKQAKARYIEVAKRTFEQAKEVVLTITDPEMKVESLMDLAFMQAKAGFIDEEKETFKEVKEAAATITNLYWQSQALIDLAFMQAKAGDIEEAKATFQEAKETAATITNPWLKAIVLSQIAVDQAIVGDTFFICSSLEKVINAAVAIGVMAMVYFMAFNSNE